MADDLIGSLLLRLFLLFLPGDVEQTSLILDDAALGIENGVDIVLNPDGFPVGPPQPEFKIPENFFPVQDGGGLLPVFRVDIKFARILADEQSFILIPEHLHQGGVEVEDFPAPGGSVQPDRDALEQSPVLIFAVSERILGPLPKISFRLADSRERETCRFVHNLQATVRD